MTVLMIYGRPDPLLQLPVDPQRLDRCVWTLELA